MNRNRCTQDGKGESPDRSHGTKTANETTTKRSLCEEYEISRRDIEEFAAAVAVAAARVGSHTHARTHADGDQMTERLLGRIGVLSTRPGSGTNVEHFLGGRYRCPSKVAVIHCWESRDGQVGFPGTPDAKDALADCHNDQRSNSYPLIARFIRQVITPVVKRKFLRCFIGNLYRKSIKELPKIPERK